MSCNITQFTAKVGAKHQSINQLTIQSYARQLNILTNRTTAFGNYSVLIPKDSVGSSLIGRLKI
jgi:hypothetical protein